MSFRDTPSMNKPSIRFTEKELPQVKDWEINKKYTLQIEVTMKNKGEDIWGERGMGGTFLIESVKAIEDDRVKKLKEKFQ